MKILNLASSDIPYKLSRFPDGEVQISLGEFNHRDQVCVNAELLMPRNYLLYPRLLIFSIDMMLVMILIFSILWG